MRMHLLFSFAAAIASSLFAMGGEPLANADEFSGAPGIALGGGGATSRMNCGAVTADKTITLGANGGDASGQEGRGGKPADCGAFVVDFAIDHSVAGAVRIGAKDAARESQISDQEYFARIPKGDCASYVHSVAVYKKKGNDPFTQIGGGELKPTWIENTTGIPPACQLTPGANYKTIPLITPPAAGAPAETIRVAIFIANDTGTLFVSATHPGQ